MSDNNPSCEDPFGQIADEFVEAFRQGQRPSVEEFARRYPEHADEIRDMLPALVLMEKAKTADDGSGQRRQAKAAAGAATLEQLGDYQILREVGRGGMGVVYEAQQLSLGRHVAIKVLPSHALLDPRQLARFQREARSAAKLHHTNIVPVFGVGEQDGLHYFVMQFIQGLGLDLVLDELRRLRLPRGKQAPTQDDAPVRPTNGTRDVSAVDVARSLLTGEFTASGGRQPPENRPQPSDSPITQGANAPRSPDMSATIRMPGQTEASTLSESGSEYWQSVARVGMQVADALAHAASQGILHRDIKPSNLLLDDTGNVWVTDFGLAKAASDSDDLTHTGDIVGTLRYMASERFDGQGDLRSDVYSRGLTLYELLALRPAFDEADRNKLVKEVMHGEPVRPRKLNPAVPRDLETVVLKAIARDPEHRYQTPAEMAEDLKRFVEDRPVRARRISEAERVWRWCRRNPSVSVMALAVVLALALGTTVSYLKYLEAKQQKAIAEDRGQAADKARVKAEKNERAERWGRYQSNIVAASAALQLQHGGAARNSLDDAPKEHRNWEWRHLQSQLDGASLVLPMPGGKHMSLVLSPSGRQIAVCCENQNAVYLYDVASGKLDAVLREHTASATSVAYRPDGKQIATSSDDQTIRLWDPATGRQTAILKAEVAPPNLDRNPLVAYSSDGSRIASYSIYAADDGGVTCRLWNAATGKEIAVLAKWQANMHPLAFSPDGRRVAVGSGEHVYLCDAVTGRRLAVLGPHAKQVIYLAFSPDGKRIASATAADSGNIHLWDGDTGKEVAVLRGHAAQVNSLIFSPDGSRLVSGSGYPENKANLWDTATGRLLASLDGHKNLIWAVAFSPDGRRAVTASSDRSARLWDGRTGQLLAVLGGHTNRVKHVLISPNGTCVITASDDTTLRLWDAQAGALIGVLRGHGDGFWCPPVFTPDGSRLVSGSDDGTVRIWDMGLVERNGILKGHESYVYDVAFSSNGEQVASAGWDGSARLWDATTGRQTGLPLKHETKIVNSVAYSRDGRQLATGERKRGVTLWDVASGKPTREWRLPVGNFHGDSRASVNPAGTLLAAGCAAGPVRLWDVATGREVARLEGHDKESKDAVFRPDGSLLATTGIDGTVRLWDVATHAPVAVLRGHTDIVWRAAFSADGKLLASASSDKTICLWDTRTHEQLADIPLASIVFSVAFSPDSTRLAAGCQDSTIRLFDVARHQEVAVLRGHTDYVHAVAWSPDGSRLVSGSGDFTVRVWDSLSVQERAKQADAKVASKR